MEPKNAQTHILFLTHYFPPEGNAPASRTHEHCRRWVKAGWKVTVITCAPNVPRGKVYDGYRNRLTQSETIDGIRVIRIWTWLAANKGTVGRILNYVTYMVSATLRGFFVHKPDVVIATSPQFFCGWAGVLLTFLRRKPFLLEIRDIWPESIATVGAMKSGLAMRFLGFLERKMYQSADRIVTVGNGYKQQLIARGVPADEIDVVTNGVDLTVYTPGERSDALAEELGFAGRFVVAYVGTIGMACGLDCVLDAGERLREQGRTDILFLIVGDGARRDELEADARKRGLENVRFTGLISKEQIPELLRSVDVCLVHLREAPLFRSVLPSKIFEAFASARPVIIGVEGEAAELVSESGGGFTMPPEDAETLADLACQFADEPELVATCGAKSRAFVEQKFDRDGLAESFLEIVRSLTK